MRLASILDCLRRVCGNGIGAAPAQPTAAAAGAASAQRLAAPKAPPAPAPAAMPPPPDADDDEDEEVGCSYTSLVGCESLLRPAFDPFFSKRAAITRRRLGSRDPPALLLLVKPQNSCTLTASVLRRS